MECTIKRPMPVPWILFSIELDPQGECFLNRLDAIAGRADHFKAWSVLKQSRQSKANGRMIVDNQ
jgi:hypothetical protein